MKKLFITLSALMLTVTAPLTIETIAKKNLDGNEPTQTVVHNYNNLKRRANTSSTINGLGYGVNAVKSDIYDLTEIRTGAPIFDIDWLSTLNEQKLNYNNTKSRVYNQNSFDKISQDFSANFNFTSSASADLYLFKAGVSNGFQISYSNNYTKYRNQYYYMYNMQYNKYTLNLPEYASNLSLYTSHLNDNYLDALDTLFSTNDYKTFFDTYGTHIIGKAVYGSSLNFYYSVITNYINVANNFGSRITSSLTAGIEDVVDAGYDMNFSIELITGMSSEQYVENTYINATGGDAFSLTDIENFADNFEKWIDTIDGKETIIGYTSDGLIPMWKLLPSQYKSKETTLKNWFESYYNQYINSVETKYDYEGGTPPSTYIENTRTGEARINGVSEYFDLVSFNDLDYDYRDYVNHGYKNADIHIGTYIKEVDRNCVQMVAIANYVNTYPIEDWNPQKFKLGGDTVVKNWTYHTFSFYDVPLKNLANKDKFCLVIRFGSDNALWDTKNVTLTINFYK